MAQERVILGFGRVPIVEALKGAAHRFSTEERARRLAKQKSELRGYALEAIDTYGVIDVYDVREVITDLLPNPGHRSNRKAPAVPQVWQALLELQRAGVLNCDTVPEIDPHTGKETGKVRFLWSRTTEGNTPIHP